MTAYGDSQRIESEIGSILGNTREFPEEFQASLARYICVLASSYLESAFRDLLLSFANKKASPSVCRYVDSCLAGFRDPNMAKIVQLLNRFDPEFGKLLDFQTEGKLKDSVDSIYANRNNIAHGRRSGISIGQIRGYFSDAKLVVSKAQAILAAKNIRP